MNHDSRLIKSREVHLPISRIRTIMKSSPDVENVSQESLYLITKSTELFLAYLAQLAYKNTNDKEFEIGYNHLAHVVQEIESLEFLHDIIPKKITGLEYLEILAQQEQNDDDF